MSDFFEHYPSSADELVGIAGELVRDARNAHATVTDMQHGMPGPVDDWRGQIQPLDDPDRFRTPGHLHRRP
jgi:hypothetical protein